MPKSRGDEDTEPFDDQGIRPWDAHSDWDTYQKVSGLQFPGYSNTPEQRQPLPEGNPAARARQLKDMLISGQIDLNEYYSRLYDL